MKIQNQMTMKNRSFSTRSRMKSNKLKMMVMFNKMENISLAMTTLVKQNLKKV